MLTKSQEIELFDSTVANLPHGYIRDILADLRIAIVNAVSNDFGFVDWRMMQAETQRMTIERDRLAKEVELLRSQCREAGEITRKAGERLDEIRSTARQILAVK